MRITNESSVSTERVQHLLEFGLAYCPWAQDVELVLLDTMAPGTLTTGLAQRTDEIGVRPRVTLELSSELRYPLASEYRKSVGIVVMLNWEEEVLMVLLHELRHIQQFQAAKMPRNYECDAERFAKAGLAQYRGFVSAEVPYPAYIQAPMYEYEARFA